MADGFEDLARDEADHASAREAIWRALDGGGSSPKAYAALCRWTWRAMIERRLDEELRSWHRLLLDTAARMEAGAEAALPGRRRARLDGTVAAERVRALADLVRLSVEAGEVSVVKQLTGRAHVQEILRLLADQAGKYLGRGTIRGELGLGDANLSRVLTLLAANGLVDRLTRGRKAAFAITQRGIALVEATKRADAGVFIPVAIPACLTPVSLQPRDGDHVFRRGQLVAGKPGQAVGRHTSGSAGDGLPEHEPLYSYSNVYHLETASRSGFPARAQVDRLAR